MLFFFFFFLKKYELSAKFGSEKYAEMWEFGLRNLIKAEMDNFDEGIWCYLSVQQAVTQMVGDGGEKAAAGGYWVQSLKEPLLCAAPILEL